MGRLVTTAMLGMGLLAGAAGAADPCRTACLATRGTCLTDAATAFATAQAACPTTKPDRRTCLATARQTRAAARSACRSTAKACKLACPASPGPVCGSHGDGITAVNVHRTTAGLPPVTERADLSAGDLAHAQYIVATDTLTHPEDPGNPHFTPEGNAAGLNSAVAAFSTALAGPTQVVDVLMAAPFHGVGLIDPRLLESGFGIAHDAAGDIRTGGAIDVLSSRGAVPAGVAYPVLYPADGTTLPLTAFPGNESPDPLTSCAGFTAPTGAPVIVQLDGPPSVSAHTLTRNGVPLDHCIFDETTYANPADAGQQALGRNVLQARHAIVILPRAVLKPGSYAASITTGGQTVAWSFTVSCPRGVPGF